jgi:hypothetical protein
VSQPSSRSQNLGRRADHDYDQDPLQHLAEPSNLPDYLDPPLDVDELPGWLDGWQRRPDGWFGQPTYRYPVHGFGLYLRYIEWLPAGRLRLP